MGVGDRMGPMVRWNRLGCPWPLSRKLATLFPGLLVLWDAAKTLVVVGCLAGEKVDRQGRVWVFRWLFLFQSVIFLFLLTFLFVFWN